MTQLSTTQRLKETETEVAVLQVQYSNITEKVDDMRDDLKDLRLHLDQHMTSMHASINSVKDDNKKAFDEFKIENRQQHDAVEKKVNSLEKWKWMLMGAGVLAGAMGFPILEKIAHVH